LDIQIAFTPETSRDYSGELFPNGQVTVPLRGHGTAPVAVIFPDSLDFGNVPVGCAFEEIIQLLNSGDEPLLVNSAFLITESDFSIQDFEPVTLAPGEAKGFEATFAPQFGSPQSVVLHLETNDPVSPVVALGLDANGYLGDVESESFSYQPTSQTDFLLVQDSSISVTARMEEAEQYTQGFLETLDSAGVNWQISLVRQDQDCLANPTPWLQKSDGAVLAAEYLNTEFTRPGTGNNRLLETAVASLERTDPGDCLDGFLRPDAQLHAILIGDQREGSPSGAEDYVATMSTHLQNPEDLVVSVVMGHGTDGCQDLGQAADAVQATGGAELDICNTDWGDHFAALAQLSINAVPSVQAYTLLKDPFLDTIEVWHNGGRLTAWEFEQGTRRLTVYGDEAGLETSADLVVSYVGTEICFQ
jgi:hypothetical protein